MNNIHDLRTALNFLREIPGQIVETDVEVDPEAELCGVYRYVGAGGTVPRPTKEGPVMIFNNIKGHPDARVVIGLLASRTRVARLLDADPRRLGFLLNDAVLNPIPPVEVPTEEAVCQEGTPSHRRWLRHPQTCPRAYQHTRRCGSLYHLGHGLCI